MTGAYERAVEQNQRREAQQIRDLFTAARAERDFDCCGTGCCQLPEPPEPTEDSDE